MANIKLTWCNTVLDQRVDKLGNFVNMGPFAGYACRSIGWSEKESCEYRAIRYMVKPSRFLSIKEMSAIIILDTYEDSGGS